jgi:hypothetical protein
VLAVLFLHDKNKNKEAMTKWDIYDLNSVTIYSLLRLVGEKHLEKMSLYLFLHSAARMKNTLDTSSETGGKSQDW